MFDDCMLFITCPTCRNPIKDDGGGCHNWNSSAFIDNPRVTRQYRACQKIGELME